MPSSRNPSFSSTLAYTCLFTAMLAACHALVGRALHLRHLRPSRWLTGTLAVLTAAWFAALIVPSTPWAPLELPVLIGVCLVACPTSAGNR